MRDLETGSEWSHLLGRAMAGELKNRELKPIVSDMVTWAVWKQQHPQTTLLHMPTRVKHYTTEFYRKPSKFVFGFDANGSTFALPMDQMLKHPVHHFQVETTQLLATFDKAGMAIHLFDPQIEGRSLNFEVVDERLMVDRQTKSQWELSSGRCVDGELKGEMLTQRVGIMSYRFAWENFHPDSKDVRF